MFVRWLPVVCSISLIMSLSACGGASSSDTKKRIESAIGGKLKTVIPLKGIVTVDGKPEKDVGVFVYQLDKLDAKQPFAETRTDKEGKFGISTYGDQDGIEKGDYVLTFGFQKWRPGKSKWSGPDKLNERYIDPTMSEFKVTVGETPKTDLKFELKTGS